MVDDIIYKDKYIWNRYKNERNKQKHGIDFETASLVFDDPFLFETYDDDNSSLSEERFNVTGTITGLINGALVTVSVVYRGDMIRIFSARKADSAEWSIYYDQFQAFFG